MIPAVELLRVTDATPPVVVAEAADSVPVPLMMAKFTVVPFAIVPLATSTGVRVAVRVTGV
jgi:hypothetical protein